MYNFLQVASCHVKPHREEKSVSPHSGQEKTDPSERERSNGNSDILVHKQISEFVSFSFVRLAHTLVNTVLARSVGYTKFGAKKPLSNKNHLVYILSTHITAHCR